MHCHIVIIKGMKWHLFYSRYPWVYCVIVALIISHLRLFVETFLHLTNTRCGHATIISNAVVSCSIYVTSINVNHYLFISFSISSTHWWLFIVNPLFLYWWRQQISSRWKGWYSLDTMIRLVLLTVLCCRSLGFSFSSMFSILSQDAKFVRVFTSSLIRSFIHSIDWSQSESETRDYSISIN